MDSKRTGGVIAACRKQKNMTQQELADALGVSNRTVSKWETGQGLPDIGLLENLSHVLGIPIDTLFYGFGDSQPEVLESPPPQKQDSAQFICIQTVSASACRRLFGLTDAAIPFRTVLLTLLWGILGAMALTLTVLMGLRSPQAILPHFLWLLIPALLLLWGYQGYRLRAYWYYKKHSVSANVATAYEYRFTGQGLQIAVGEALHTLPYDTITRVLHTSGDLILYYGHDVALLKAEGFAEPGPESCLSFLKERCPGAHFSPPREQTPKHVVMGSICLMAAALCIGVQAVVRVLGPRLQIELARDGYGVALTVLAILLLLSGGALLCLRRSRRSMGVCLAAVLLVSAGAVLLTPPIKNDSIVSHSKGLRNSLVLKTDKASGKTTRYRLIAPFLAMKREELPYTVDGPVKTQWLTPDVCAVTYTSPDDGSIHQYVATYGDRSDGVSYYYVSNVIHSSSMTQTVDSAGWQLQVETDSIRIGDANGMESFQFEDCVQFGTTALVLCRQGRPVWTLALGEDCLVEGGVLVGKGSVIACRVSMDKTAPITFSISPPPSNKK